MENIEKIIEEYGKHAEENGFALNPDRKKLELLIRGLLENEKKYGKRYCPCRRISGDAAQDRQKICPCQQHRKQIERDGQCFCGLFVKKV